MRVKTTFTFSAIGTCAPLFVAVIGLNKCNLYGQKNLLIWVKELYVEDGWENIDNSTYEYALLIVK